jgi:hypothetical protein
MPRRWCDGEYRAEGNLEASGCLLTGQGRLERDQRGRFDRVDLRILCGEQERVQGARLHLPPASRRAAAVAQWEDRAGTAHLHFTVCRAASLEFHHPPQWLQWHPRVVSTSPVVHVLKLAYPQPRLLSRNSSAAKQTAPLAADQMGAERRDATPIYHC